MDCPLVMCSSHFNPLFLYFRVLNELYVTAQQVIMFHRGFEGKNINFICIITYRMWDYGISSGHRRVQAFLDQHSSNALWARAHLLGNWILCSQHRNIIRTGKTQIKVLFLHWFTSFFYIILYAHINIIQMGSDCSNSQPCSHLHV